MRGMFIEGPFSMMNAVSLIIRLTPMGASASSLSSTASVNVHPWGSFGSA